MGPGVVCPGMDIDGDILSLFVESGVQAVQESGFPVVPHVDSLAGDRDGFRVEQVDDVRDGDSETGACVAEEGLGTGVAAFGEPVESVLTFVCFK